MRYLGNADFILEYTGVSEFSEFGDGDRKHRDWSIMQYTGLKDKNGKDIYEGDIVRCNIHEREQFDEHYSGIPVEVKWSDKSGGFYPFVIASGWRSSVEDVELLGNVHQNPELIPA